MVWNGRSAWQLLHSRTFCFTNETLLTKMLVVPAMLPPPFGSKNSAFDRFSYILWFIWLLQHLA